MDRSRENEQPIGPDYSHVTTLERVQMLVDRGELVAMLKLPEELGGEDTLDNTIFVPPFVAEHREGMNQNVIFPLIEEGKVRRYNVTPEYVGASFVPIAIRIRAYDPIPGMSGLVAIWGAALSRPPGSWPLGDG